MAEEQTLNNFIRTIILLAKLNNLIRDKFFYDKLGEKISELTASYIEHNGSFEKISVNIDSILEMMDSLRYLNLARVSPLFLQVQKNLLILKLQAKKSKNKFPVYEPKSIGSPTLDLQKGRTSVTRKKSLELNQSKKKILEFIRSYPNIRTKDIITEFNALSDRTVKRNLTDLLRTGLVKKRVDNKAVYYYCEVRS